MKITFDREQFSAAFQTAAAVAPRNTPKPILSNVKLEVGDAGAVLMGTDLEVGIRMQVQGVEVEQPGAAVLPVGRFGSILRETSDERLSLEADNQGAVVRGARAEFKLPGADPAEFPTVAEFAEEKYHEVPARLLREVIRRTVFAADVDTGRFALQGVLLELDENTITAVATDSRRLAKMEGPAVSVGGHTNKGMMTIVPARAMHLLERALADGDAEVQIVARTNDVLIRSPRATITSRLVEGRFPKWRDVFPTRTKAVKIELTVGPIFSAVRQAAIATDQDSQGVDFTFADGTLLLAARAADVGQSRIETPIPYDGPKIELTLNHKYVADFFKVLDPEKQFTLEVMDADSAALFTTDDGYGYVVMPLSREGRE
jgi:DNA polymerase III subunit beta